jgi:carboxylesterase
MILNPHLEGGPFLWESGPIGILLIHGFTATTAEVRPLATFLNDQGYTVAGNLLPGHNTQPQDLNRVSWRDWIASSQEAYEVLADRCDQVVVGGESTGGVAGLYLASCNPEINAVLLYAPALRLNLSIGEMLALYLLAPIVPFKPKSNPDTRGKWQGYSVHPLKGAIQLVRMEKVVMRRLGLIHQPTLIVQGRKDDIVHPAVPEIICKGIHSTIKEIHWMDNSEHCVILDCELGEVADITARFLKKVIPDS